MASVYRRGTTWWVRFVHRGKRIQRSAHTTRKAEAMRFLIKAQNEAQDDRPRYKFEAMAQRFLADHLPLLKPKTAAGYRIHVRMMVEQFGDLWIDEVNKARIAEYISTRRKAGSGSATIRRHLATLGSMYARAIGWGWIESNPARTFDKRAVPEARPRVRYLTHGEYHQLMAHVAQHLRPIIEIAVQTGMRSEELLSLTWSQVNLDRREVTLTKTKSGTPRVIPLSDGAVATFVATARHVTSPYVFCDPLTGRRYKSLKNAFRSACARAGIRDFRFHDLRHTFASWAVQGGMDLYRLSRILGHTTTQMTARYAHLATIDLHDAVRKVATNLATGAEDWTDTNQPKSVQDSSKRR